MVVDCHAHLYHPSWYPPAFQDSLAKDFVRRQRDAGREVGLDKARQMLGSLLRDGDGSRTVRLMDKVGIDRKLVLVVDWGLALGEAEKPIATVNEEVLRICAAFPDRLTGFAGVDPRRDDAAALVRRAIDDLGARGLKLHPTTGWRLDDERTLEVVAVATGRRVPVLVHVGKTLDVLTDRHAAPQDLIGLARAFPDGVFVAGHAGFDRWREFAGDAGAPDNLHFDISGWQEIVEGDPERLKGNLFGLMAAFPGRVYFGTDGPFYSFNLVASEQHWLRMVVDCLRECPEALAGSAASVTDPPRIWPPVGREP